MSLTKNMDKSFSITQTTISTWRIVADLIIKRPGALIACLLLNIAANKWQAAVALVPTSTYVADYHALWEEATLVLISSIMFGLYSAPIFVVVQNHVFASKSVDGFDSAKLRSWFNVLLSFVLIGMAREISTVYRAPYIPGTHTLSPVPAFISFALSAIFFVWLPARLFFSPVYLLLGNDNAFSKSWIATSGRVLKISAVYFLATLPILCIGFAFKWPWIIHRMLHEGMFVFAAAATAACFSGLSLVNGSTTIQKP